MAVVVSSITVRGPTPPHHFRLSVEMAGELQAIRVQRHGGDGPSDEERVYVLGPDMTFRTVAKCVCQYTGYAQTNENIMAILRLFNFLLFGG